MEAEAATLGALIEPRTIPGRRIPRHARRTPAWRASRLNRLLHAWVVAAVVLVFSISETVAHPGLSAQPKTVLFLQSFGANFYTWSVWSREIRKELIRQSPWPLDVQEQSLATARNDDSAAEAKFVEYLAALYAQRPPDLIVAIGGPAARFVQRHRTDLFPTAPMLLAAVEVRRIEPSMLSDQDAVVAVRFDEVVLVENILRLLPQTKTIAFIIGSSPFERHLADEQRRILRPLLESKIDLVFYDERTFGEILKEVAGLPPHSAIFYQQPLIDSTGAVYGDKEPLKRIYRVANAPIFTFDLSFFEGGVVGGPMFSPVEGGRLTAAVGVRMLRGEKAGDIKVPPIEFSAPKYDWRQLKRWNISESRLPRGSEILFRESTIWERYSWQIALIVAIILLQSGLISVLLGERGRRRLAEVQSRQRMAELAHVNRFSMAGELTASIAHEINQPLGAILTNAETADAILQSSNPDITELKDIVKDILLDDRRASEVIRRMRSLLKKAPFEAKDIDLNDVARESVGFLSALAIARKVELFSVITPSGLPILGDRIQLQQVILNLVVNGIDAMKDTAAGSRIISIRTSRIGHFAQLSVSDRGPGVPEGKLREVFEPFFTSKSEGMGMGLSIARTIVEAHHGQIWVENRDHGGASFRIKLPLRNDGEEPTTFVAEIDSQSERARFEGGQVP